MLAASILFGMDVKIEIGPATGSTVSPYLTGMNAVYSHENMNTWSDGSKARHLKDAGIGCLRYPGGHVVSFWDWEFPYHNAYQNFWDPAYTKSLTPKRKAELKAENGQRMKLDDFFAICAAADMEPIVGINMFQGYKFNRLEDSVAKAVRLVEHCKKQNPKVKYYFLDNEAGHQPTKGNHIPIDEYIKLIPSYSEAIKAAQPEAKLIVNPIGWNRMRDMAKKVGQHFDIYDIHWYYSNRKWGLFYIEDWRKEKESRKFSNQMAQFRKLKEESGHKHLQLGLLEWNLGPSTGDDNSDPSSFLFQGLVQADMLMQFMEHDVFMAAAWPLMWKPKKKTPDGYRNFLDQETGRPSPSKNIFKWISMASGGTILRSSSPSPDGIRHLAVQAADGNTMLVYLLNKSKGSRDIVLTFKKPVASVTAGAFEEGKGPNDVLIRTVPTETAGKTATLQMSDTSFVCVKITAR